MSIGALNTKTWSLKLINQNQNPEQNINPLEEYGINLTHLAAKGKIDPVIGREDENSQDSSNTLKKIKRTIQF